MRKSVWRVPPNTETSVRDQRLPCAERRQDGIPAGAMTSQRKGRYHTAVSQTVYLAVFHIGSISRVFGTGQRVGTGQCPAQPEGKQAGCV